MNVVTAICCFFCQRCLDSQGQGRQAIEEQRHPLSPQDSPSPARSEPEASATPDSAFGGGQTQQGTVSKGSPPRRPYGDGFPIDRGRGSSGLSHRAPPFLPPDRKA